MPLKTRHRPLRLRRFEKTVGLGDSVAMETVAPLGVQNYRRIVILTGAGVSVASGLPTYRGPGGLWETEEIARIVDAESLPESLPALWQLYSERRRVALQAMPNAAHAAITALQQRYPERVTLLTQNVDGLHQRSGAAPVVELHGSAFQTRCTVCPLPSFDDTASYDQVPRCPECGGFLRPAVTLFGEQLPTDALWAAKRALRDVDLFLAVGTSGSVYPAASFVNSARYSGARCYLVNIERSVPKNPCFHSELIGPAEVILPKLLAG